MVTVKTPVTGWSGTFNGDTFVDGVCDSPSEANLGYYRRHGYTIEEAPSDVVPDSLDDAAPGIDAPLERPADNAKKATWVAYAEAHGIDTEGMTTTDIIAAVDAL